MPKTVQKLVIFTFGPSIGDALKALLLLLLLLFSGAVLSLKALLLLLFSGAVLSVYFVLRVNIYLVDPVLRVESVHFTYLFG